MWLFSLNQNRSFLPDSEWLNSPDSNTAEETFEQVMRPLRNIQDNYEKIVLTLDRFSTGNYEGIKVVNVIDWLLE